jgi:circadian clock protein KaiC
MKPSSTKRLNPLKARTGIEGFDEITNGGLPRGRTTLIEGGPGSGKTIMALQSLVNGALIDNEPGIFVAFEERTEQITLNAAKFGWDLVDLQKKKKLFLLNAQPTLDLVQSGSFDLGGMLAALDAKVREIKAKRIVFDAVDVILSLLADPIVERREIYRINEWLVARGMTGIITSKADSPFGTILSQPQLGFVQYVADCAVILGYELVHGVSQRNMRVVKFRGSAHSENESPFVITSKGLEVADTREQSQVKAQVTSERVPTGVERLDTMLEGGYYRGASVLITGLPGAAKSTLSGAFAEAACQRGEKTLFVSFDSDISEMIRNLASVNIRLERFVKNGMFRMFASRSTTSSAELHLMRIKSAAREFGARCLVIDPVAALTRGGADESSHNVAERLVDWTKAAGITLVCTSPSNDMGSALAGTPLQISALSDTWIHLSYVVVAGERNRGLSIIKSRGTPHSNQVREVVLSNTGVDLTDVYTAGGEVLMGTLRWEKEQAEHAAREEFDARATQRKTLIDNEEAELEARLTVAQRLLDVKRSEKQLFNRLGAYRAAELNKEVHRLGELRGIDKI